MADRTWPGPLLRERVLDVVRDLEKRGARLRDDPDDIEALHGYRKGARRTWAAVQLTEAYLTPIKYAEAVTLTVPLAKGLGACRDHDVLAKRIGAIAKQHRTAKKALERVIPAMPAKERRERVQRATRRSKPSRLGRPLEDALDGMARATLDPLAHMRATLRLRSRRITAHASVHALHALRLELKAYRYGIEALKPRANTTDAHVARECHAAMDVLGRIIDAHVLAGLAKGAQGRSAPILLTAARKDDEAARHDFGVAWTTKWPALQAELKRPMP